MPVVEKLLKLKAAIEAQAQLCIEIIDAALIELGAPDEDTCPHCGMSGKLEETGSFDAPGRWTCLACGKSHQRIAAAEEEVGND